MAELRPMPVLRVVFLVAVAVFAWLGLRGRFDEVGAALRDTPPAGTAAALLLVLVGLLATGLLWLRLMSALGAPLPVVGGLATFFVGQLGKYIPGSIWSLGAQAQLARGHDVPARTTVAAGLLFLGCHVDTAVLVASVAVLSGALESPWPSWVWVFLLCVGTVGLLPPVVRALGHRVSGKAMRLDAADTTVIVALMAVAWTTYALALVLLSPGVAWGDLSAVGGAFAAAYAVGVVVVFAPAGVGAREAVFVLLLTPVTGLGVATAVALLARVVHTGADALMAAAWWFLARRATRRRPVRASA